MLVQVYVDGIISGSTKKSMCTEFEDCMHKRFQMSFMGELTFFLVLQVKQQLDGIFISQDKTATTPIESNKPLVKDEDDVDVDVHVYRSMIGSLMYLTTLRPDIMFAVCAYARFQVTPKASHLNAVKRIFRYLKHQPKLGLWYPRDSPFELEAYSDSDYRGASLDRKSTIGGYQFLGRRLISWQCKKQTIMENSTTKAEYVAAANCYLLTNGFDVTRFNFLVVSIGLLNLESLERDIDGTEELLLPDLLILWLTKVSNDSAKYITTKVAGKPVNISKASIRSDLLFDDADGIDSLHNEAIFDAIQLMGPLPINALTSKVFSFMVKKGKYFSGNVTPLFESMLVQPTEDEGEASERQFEPQPTPSPPHPSANQHETQPDPSHRPSPIIPIPDSILEGSGRNHGGQSSSDKSLSGNEDGLTLQSVYDLYVSLCKQVTDQAKEIKHLKA
ncbi:hypothetical protein Tco_0246627 [Tanacetum coccineum]